MRKNHQRLLLLGGSSFFLFLCVNAVLVVCARSVSREGGLVLAAVAALAEAGILVYFRRQQVFSFRRSAQRLPERLEKQLEELSPRDQFQVLCQVYEEKNEVLTRYSVDRFLTRLLGDNSHTHVIENLDRQVRNILQSEAFGYKWSAYCLVYVKMEDYSSYMLKNCNGRLQLGDFRKMYDVVSHAFDVTLNRNHLAHGVEWKNATVFLVNLSGTTEETPRDELEQMVDRLCAACEDTVLQVHDSFNVTLEAAVSVPFRDAIETHGIFEWLLTMKEYCDFVHGTRNVVGPVDFRAFLPEPQTAPGPMKKNYYSALLVEDFARAEQMLFDMKQYFLGENGYSISALKDMVSQCLSAAEEIATSNSDAPESVSALDWRSGIYESGTLEELDSVIHGFFNFLVSRAASRKHECSSTAQKIIDFLDEHFTCPELSVAMLSESLSLSPSYISRIFKRETGTNIPDYIHEKRICMAKRMLAESDLPVADIATQVGYATTWTMNRIFKRTINMTPGAWRQLARSGKEESAL